MFADEGEAADAARRAFENWVRALPRAPGRSVDLVRSVELQCRHVARLTTDVEARRVVECYEPAPGQPARAQSVRREQVDPWAPPDDLARISRFIAPCWTCAASGLVDCAACSATGRTACTDCDGSGKYHGVTANGARRLLNCKTCRGKGRLACDRCTRGKVGCSTCHRAKKLAGWLEVRSEVRRDVLLVPAAPEQLAFGWSHPGVRASDEQLANDALVIDTVTRSRALTLDDLSAAVPANWRIEHGARLRPHLAAGERVQAQTLTLLAVPSASVTYSLSGRLHSVEFAGFRMVAPPARAGCAEPFLRRARVLRHVTFSVGVLPLAAAATFLARGDYFTSGRAGGAVAALVVACATAACLAYATVWNVMLGRRRARFWALAAIVPVIAAVTAAAVAEPRLGRARDLVVDGRLAEAASELHALHLPPADDAWADLHLHNALVAVTCADASVHLRNIREALPQRGQAREHADELAVAEAHAALRVADPDAASAALACGSETLRRKPIAVALRMRVADVEAHKCLSIKNWACALERAEFAVDPASLRSAVLATIRSEADLHATAATHTADLEQRVREDQAALTLWATYLLDSHSTETPPRPVLELRAALARDQAALATQQRIADARAKAEARREAAAAERERKREEAAAERERRRQAAEEERARRASRGLVCNDGTLSPSCTCDGPHRGCCSWHGGVAGCAD